MKRYIVIAHNGDPSTNQMREEIAEYINKSCNAVAIEITEVSEFELDLVRKANNAKSTDDDGTPEDEAVIYIGSIFKNELANFNPSKFTGALANKIAEASNDPSKESNKRFMNSLFILSKDELLISQNLMKKYKLDRQRISLIKNVYNLLSKS